MKMNLINYYNNLFIIYKIFRKLNQLLLLLNKN